MIITLIGMPGSGKSCMGKAVAPKLKMKNIDADAEIERRYGQKLQDIINTKGLLEFKRIEEEVLLSLNSDNTIISTGGSAIYYPAAMEHLKAIGKIVYLKVSLPILIERLGDFSKRGIAMRDGQTIEDLYNERCELYEKYADKTISCNGTAYPKYRKELINYINMIK
jgi:shikimate kinase